MQLNAHITNRWIVNESLLIELNVFLPLEIGIVGGIVLGQVDEMFG